jgi:hypothetical protein
VKIKSIKLVNNSKTIVYWANNAHAHFSASFFLQDMEPKSVIADLQKDVNLVANKSNGNYRNCPAFANGLKNTFFLPSPLDFTLEAKKDTSGKYSIHGEFAEFFIPRYDIYSNRISFDLDIGWLVFSEKSLLLKQTPPYSHHTTFSNYGTVPTGAFDIGKWFRPISPAFMLWPNIERLEIKKGEPLAYLHFDTKDKIIFKQFMPTQKLLETAYAGSKHSYFMPRLTLNERYEHFKTSRLRGFILKEIKNNLML